MKLVINAANVHVGGGRVLLLDLLSAVDAPAIAILDARLKLPAPLPAHIQTIFVEPSLLARLQSERRLASICDENDVVIAFGNLPPLYPNRSKVFVYLQNRYLTSFGSLAGLSLRFRGRLAIERLWLRLFLRNSRILVQTRSMAEEVRTGLGRDAIVAGFAPAGTPVAPLPKQYDFVYVASGEAHKNHRRLVEAWALLAREGLYPTLRLTLDSTRDRTLLHWVETAAARDKLNIENAVVDASEISAVYARSLALIYPSLSESFGLPLIEADRAGLGIVASERDFVRDVVVPSETFDPELVVSIARAVKRRLRAGQEETSIPTARQFLTHLLEMR